MTRLRMYHPDYRVTIWDRIYDFFTGHRSEPRQDGVDYTLLNRASLRYLRDFLDGLQTLSLPGDEMVRVESRFQLPEDPIAFASCCDGLTARLRVVQILSEERHVPLLARWFQYEKTRQGTRLLIRLAERPSPGSRLFLSGNINEDLEAGWQEYAAQP